MTTISSDVTTADAPAEPPRQVPTAQQRLRRTASFRNISAVYIFAALFIIFAVWEPDTFLTAKTWQLLLDNQAVTAMVAIALVVPLSAGVIDLAVGTEVGMGAIVVAWLLSRHGLPIHSPSCSPCSSAQQ